MKKVAVVTGAAGFLGLHFTQALLDGGYMVYGIDLLNSTQIKNQNYFHKNGDITDEKTLQEIFSEIARNHSKLDLLVNNAAIDHKIDSFSLSSKKNNRFEDFDHELIIPEFRVGILGSLLCSKYALKIMIPQHAGSIINIASDLSIISPNQNIYRSKDNFVQDFFKPVSYSIIKHGLVGLTKYLATYCAPYNIRCNSVSPGPVLNNQPEEFLERLRELIPLGRLANPDEITKAVIFLASSDSSYLTGHNLVVDGGRTIW